jgi:hypothetical protein
MFSSWYSSAVDTAVDNLVVDKVADVANFDIAPLIYFS